MGFLFSKPEEPPPPPPPLFDKPWRDLSWRDGTRSLDFIRQFKPDNEDINHLRVLQYGPVGAGKSSFTNSVKNMLLQQNSHLALASALTAEKSFTKKFETHRIRKGRGLPKEYYPFVFNEIMGLEGIDGVRADDIKLVLKGNVKEGYRFNPVVSMSTDSADYVENPKAEDKAHVLVCFLSANAPNINPLVLKKMAEVRETASDLGIPQMMIVTHIDKACGETEKNLQNVYQSKFLKKKMEVYSTATGIPMNCIFPVKNYCDEIDPNGDVDTLILSALKQIVTFGEDLLDKM